MTERESFRGAMRIAPLLTIVVPCYNSAGHVASAVEPLLDCGPEVEIVLVDDGSTDATGRILDAYAFSHPHLVRVLHQPNGGHGSAINAGLGAARGRYFKVLDSDDRLDPVALARVLDRLRHVGARQGGVDLFVSNFVYERSGRRTSSPVRYTGVLAEERVIGWSEVGRFRKGQYLMMHSLIYRTALLREVGLRLPERTFYVDNLYVVAPLRRVRTLYYLNADLYHYSIGRDEQSVGAAVMLRRVDQQLTVTRLVLAELPPPNAVPPALSAYLLHHLEILCAITSVLLVRAGTAESLAARHEFWSEVRRQSPWVYARVRRGLLGQGSNLRGAAGRRVSVLAYRLVRHAVGFG